jgi:hypothetical protein
VDIYRPGKGIGISSRPLDPMRCKAGVRSKERWRAYSQCARKAVRDGWCKQHHPDARVERDAASSAKWAADMRRHALGYYGGRFLAALIKIRDGDNNPRQTATEALEGCEYANDPR